MKNTLITGIMAASFLLVGCGKKVEKVGLSDAPPAADERVSKEDSGLIGTWQTIEGSPTIYTFSKDNSVTQIYNGHAVIHATLKGSWKLDGEKLVIMADTQTFTDSTGKTKTVHPSSQQGTFTWTISSISDSAMTWHTSISRLGVTRDIALNLNRVSSP